VGIEFVFVAMILVRVSGWLIACLAKIISVIVLIVSLRLVKDGMI